MSNKKKVVIKSNIIRTARVLKFMRATGAKSVDDAIAFLLERGIKYPVRVSRA